MIVPDWRFCFTEMVFYSSSDFFTVMQLKPLKAKASTDLF